MGGALDCVGATVVVLRDGSGAATVVRSGTVGGTVMLGNEIVVGGTTAAERLPGDTAAAPTTTAAAHTTGINLRSRGTRGRQPGMPTTPSVPCSPWTPADGSNDAPLGPGNCARLTGRRVLNSSDRTGGRTMR
jgi:hypothetical protein